MSTQVSEIKKSTQGFEKKKLQRYVNSLPVFGLNTCRFHLNLIKSYLFFYLIRDEQEETCVIKHFYIFHLWRNTIFRFNGQSGWFQLFKKLRKSWLDEEQELKKLQIKDVPQFIWKITIFYNWLERKRDVLGVFCSDAETSIIFSEAQGPSGGDLAQTMISYPKKIFMDVLQWREIS